MVTEFEVSAPGKVILHGEHSVVYGKPAIAGVVQVRNNLRLKIKSHDDGGAKIKVNFNKLGLNFEINNAALNHFANSLRDALQTDKTLPHELDHEIFVERIDEFVAQEFAARELSSREQNSIRAFVYLLVGIKISRNFHDSPPFEVDLETGMSIGAGLGSSASFGVCLAGAFVVFSGLHKDPEFLLKFNSPEVDNSVVLKEISDWAFCSEKIMHGKPSGLDNTICTFGNVVKFYRGQEPETIVLGCPLPILLVDTSVSRSTATLVQKVVTLRERYPEVVQSIFDGMGHVVEEATKILREIREGDRDKFKDLESLVAINNNLLRAIDVSHPRLEKIFEVADRHGFKAKLSGAGGGGFAMILLGPEEDWPGRGYDKLKEELQSLEFELTETKLGGVGFQAKVLRN